MKGNIQTNPSSIFATRQPPFGLEWITLTGNSSTKQREKCWALNGGRLTIVRHKHADDSSKAHLVTRKHHEPRQGRPRGAHPTRFATKERLYVSTCRLKDRTLSRAAGSFDQPDGCVGKTTNIILLSACEFLTACTVIAAERATVV